MKITKRIVMTVLALFIAFVFPLNAVAADVPYRGYTYDREGDDRYSPNTYLPEKSCDGKALGATFVNIQDMQIFEDEMYILDSGASCIWITDTMLSKGRTLKLWNENGTEMTLKDAKGIFVSKDSIYIADTGALCVYQLDRSGKVLKRFNKPESAVYDQKVPFAPKKVLADGAGNVYALVDGLYVGAVTFAENGDFLGYYGANKVDMTFDKVLDQFWKRLLNREQRNAMERFVPMAYAGFDIDYEDFIYTCSQTTENRSLSVRKLNPSGTGLWDGRNLKFGEKFDSIDGLPAQSRFIDLDIGANGIVSVLDNARGRVFQYDDNGNLVGIFGGSGMQHGTFSNPAAIESYQDKVYVLDVANQAITIFSQTEYGQLLFMALSIYNEGSYTKAEPLWDEVLQKNPSLELAYIGKGKALFARGDYKEALDCLRHSGDREQYSKVFSRYRLQYVRENFYLYAGFVLCAAAVIWGYKFYRKNHPKTASSRLKIHFRVLFHPADTLQDLAEQHRYSPVFSTGVVLAWLLINVLEYFGTGYSFNKNNPSEFNLLVSILGTVVIYVLWVVVNWSVSTLNDGKGTMKRIYCASAYVLLPYLISRLVCLGLSQLLTLDEGAFILWIGMAGLLWSALLLLFVITQIHDYTLEKAIGNIVLTVLGCICVLFLLLLMLALYEQTVNIAKIIYNEVMLRR